MTDLIGQLREDLTNLIGALSERMNRNEERDRRAEARHRTFAEEVDGRLRKLETAPRNAAVETAGAPVVTEEQLHTAESQLHHEIQSRTDALDDARSRLERLESKLGDAERRATAAEELRSELHREIETRSDALSEARTRLERLEEQLQHAERRAEAAERMARTLDERVPARPLSVKRETGEPVDLNTATYEDLRGLGLSATQAARLMARRDTVGPFQVVDQLDDLPGFPEKLLAELKRNVQV